MILTPTEMYHLFLTPILALRGSSRARKTNKTSVFLLLLLLLLLLYQYYLIHKINWLQVWDFRKTSTLYTNKLEKVTQIHEQFLTGFQIKISSGVDQRGGDITDQRFCSLRSKIKDLLLYS